MGCLLLSGCGNTAKVVQNPSEENTDLSSEVMQSSEKQTELPVAETSKLSERNMEDFAFAGECFVETDNQYTYYRGEIIDENVKEALWNLICSQEKEPVFEGGTASIGGNAVILTDKTTEEVIYIGYNIWYASSELDGGPYCFIIGGSARKRAYYHWIQGEDIIFEQLIKQGVVREENVVER